MQFIYLFVVFLVLILVWVYSRWRWMKQYWLKKGVPHTPIHPILGSLTFLQRKNPGIWMRELYNEFKSPYVGIWVFWRPGLVVNCPDIARRVLVRDSDVFRNRLISSGNRDPIGGLNLFTVNDPLWSSVRRRLTSVFTSAKLRNLHGLYHNKAKELVQRIATDTENGIIIDLRTTYSDYTTDVIGDASFGVKSNATLTGSSPLRTTTKEFMQYSMWRGFAWSAIFFFPELVDVFGFLFFPKNSIEYFRKVFKMIVTQRGGYDNPNVGGNDLLDALLKMKQQASKENEEFSEDVLLAQATIFLQAGFDTSSMTLTYCTYELAFHPHQQEKLYEEVLEAKQKLGDKEFDAAALAELAYLNGVINEAFRKYPPMGWLDRVALTGYEVDQNVTIKAGTVVYVNAVGMQVDPEYFPEPEKFKPERFLPENETNIHPFTFLPFGEGPRHCIGKRFGLNTVRYALSLIILNFEIRPLPNAPKPNDCKVEKRGLFYMPGEPLRVQFMPRKK